MESVDSDPTDFRELANYVHHPRTWNFFRGIYAPPCGVYLRIGLIKLCPVFGRGTDTHHG